MTFRSQAQLEDRNLVLKVRACIHIRASFSWVSGVFTKWCREQQQPKRDPLPPPPPTHQHKPNNIQCTDRHGLSFLGTVRLRVHRDVGRQYMATIVALQPLPPVVPPPAPAAALAAVPAPGAPAAAGKGPAFVGGGGGGGVVVKVQPGPQQGGQQGQGQQGGGGGKPVLTWRSTRDGGRWRYAELTLAQVYGGGC